MDLSICCSLIFYLSLSLLLLSLSILLFCLSSILYPFFVSLLCIMRLTPQLCLNLTHSLSMLFRCYFDLPLPASDKQLFLVVVSACVCIFRYVSFALIGPPVFGLLSLQYFDFGGDILILLSSDSNAFLPGGIYNSDPGLLTDRRGVGD